MTPGRELGLAMGGMLAGSGLTLLAAARPWARATVSAAPGLPALDVAPTGGGTLPAVVACALVALAGVLAVVATRGVGRALVGGAVTCMGVVIVILSVLRGLDPAATVLAEAARTLGATPVQPLDAAVTGWPWVAVLGGSLTAAAGGLALVRGARWRVMGSRYDAPSARPRAEPARGMWETLDRGEDPTT